MKVQYEVTDARGAISKQAAHERLARDGDGGLRANVGEGWRRVRDLRSRRERPEAVMILEQHFGQRQAMLPQYLTKRPRYESVT